MLYHLQQLDARVAEVPITYRKRGSGQSKITPAIILRWIVDLLRIRRSAASQTSIYSHVSR